MDVVSVARFYRRLLKISIDRVDHETEDNSEFKSSVRIRENDQFQPPRFVSARM
jgi:hypothetical protein